MLGVAVLSSAALAFGAMPAEAMVIEWSPEFILRPLPPHPFPIPIPLPFPFPIPDPLPPIPLDIELVSASQVFPRCGTPCLLGGINFSLMPGVPAIPGQTFVDVEPAPGFVVDDTDGTTFLNLIASVPIELEPGDGIEIVTSVSTRNIDPFKPNQVVFEAFGSFGRERGVVEPLDVPEPSVLSLIAAGLAGLVALFAAARRSRGSRPAGQPQV